MKKKLIIGVIASIMFMSVMFINIVVKSTKEVKAGDVWPIACCDAGFCFMEDGWFLYDAIYLPSEE